MLEVPVLESLMPVLVHGADARKFMQGQHSNDVRNLSPQRALLGSCTSGQGRVQAVVTLLQREEGIVALFPTATIERMLARARASILGSKVGVEAVPWLVVPVSAPLGLALGFSLPEAPGACASSGALTLLRWWGPEPRYLVLGPPSGGYVQGAPSAAQDLAWRRADLAAGLPQVYPETQNSFVPQMLNLDVLNAISFDKGCYVGQEVVARARRGGVSRRMFRYSAACAPPVPGTRVMSGEMDVGEVVDAVPSESGCDLLAVVSLDQASAALVLDGPAPSAIARSSLPYAVPADRR
jgi:folate-binding protein YgfZ